MDRIDNPGKDHSAKVLLVDQQARMAVGNVALDVRLNWEACYVAWNAKLAYYADASQDRYGDVDGGILDQAVD